MIQLGAEFICKEWRSGTSFYKWKEFPAKALFEAIESGKNPYKFTSNLGI